MPQIVVNTVIGGGSSRASRKPTRRFRGNRRRLLQKLRRVIQECFNEDQRSTALAQRNGLIPDLIIGIPGDALYSSASGVQQRAVEGLEEMED